MRDEHKYDDIINNPHHVSKKHPPLGRDSYAAQFSPFAALVGYEDIVEETARLTEDRPELDEDEKARLSAKLEAVLKGYDGVTETEITFFEPDSRKAGGRIVREVCVVRKFDGYKRQIVTGDGKRIPVDDILDVRGEIPDRFHED